jgi:hypothetical protein
LVSSITGLPLCPVGSVSEGHKSLRLRPKQPGAKSPSKSLVRLRAIQKCNPWVALQKCKPSGALSDVKGVAGAAGRDLDTSHLPVRMQWLKGKLPPQWVFALFSHHEEEVLAVVHRGVNKPLLCECVGGDAIF